ncbi:phage NrS-1 polymerase family protein [Halomarina litorea]|uniref:phage NrS-1 polymerase family protein n=1 Tax=Halomarina litorea TaxID=2961595 RepID=UPI0020C4EC99|nr:hypothetical protein [Halomarina sp. BCD28]
MTHTSPPNIDLDRLPDKLTTRDQWVCWRTEQRDGKPTKVPVDPRTGEYASATDSTTWTESETAVEYLRTTTSTDGIGFVFTADDPLVGIDLDDGRDPDSGAIDEAASDIIERFDSYTECSPSGTGFHVLVTGTLPDGRNRRGAIEMYDSARFFTVTGEHVDGRPQSIARRQDALTAIHREYVQETDTNSTGGDDTSGEAAGRTNKAPRTDVTLTDDDLLEKARAASNGEKFDQLWNGTVAGYNSHSEADMALCCLLAFWTGGDHAWINQLFRQSGLLREKWDEIHYADGSTYGEKTIERAVATTSEFYDPEFSNEATQPSSATGGSSTGTNHDDTERSTAYRKERNRLLADRVDDLEATLEQKAERIETLEAELERLKHNTDPDQQLDAGHNRHATDSDECDEPPATASMWNRAKRLFRDDSE